MAGPSISKALLVLLAASVRAEAQEMPEALPSPARTAQEEACTPGSTGLLIDLSSARAPGEGLGAVLTPADGELDAAAARFQHVKPTPGAWSQDECRRRFASFAAACPDCAASVAPPGEVTLEVARRLFASKGQGPGGLVMSLGALTRHSDMAGLQARAAALFDGTTGARGGADGVSAAAPSLTGAAAPLAAPIDSSRYGRSPAGDPQQSLVTAEVPGVAQSPSRSSWPGAVETVRGMASEYRQRAADYLEAPGRSLAADFNESWLGYQAERARGAVERALGVDGQLQPVLPASSVTPGLVVRDSNRSWGTRFMVDLLRMTGAELSSRGMRLQVNDVSRPQGGPFWRPHRSHQRGIDADLSLAAPPGAPANAVVLAAIAKSARESGSGLQYVFSDRSVIGAYRAQLAQLAARGEVLPEDAATVSRALCHEDGHRGHFHVRSLR